MISLWDVLKASKGLPVSDFYAAMWGKQIAGKYTIAELEGALPLTFNANGEPLIDYRIYGNTEQTGTPTPENPIMPIGCGERVDITGLSEPLCGIQTYTDSLNLSTSILTRRIKKYEFTGNENIRIYEGAGLLGFSINMADMITNSRMLGASTHFRPQQSPTGSTTDGITFGAGNERVYITFSQTTISSFNLSDLSTISSWLSAQYATGTPVTVWYVLAEPETATIPVPSGLAGTIKGYLIQDGTPTPETPIYPTANGVKQADGTYIIPYGYKLPILSNFTVSNIYLGEVQTTRRIKKLVLTGEERINGISDTPYGTKAVSYQYSDLGMTDIIDYDQLMTYYPYPSYCSTHFITKSHGQNLWTDIKDGEIGANGRSSNNRNRYLIFGTSEQTQTDFKSYLAAQYAAGTPVTVWYVLAEPETAVVNEPLMKIGDYADTVSMEQAGVSIPTNNGTTVIDYDGTPKPEKMYIKYLEVKK